MNEERELSVILGIPKGFSVRHENVSPKTSIVGACTISAVLSVPVGVCCECVCVCVFVTVCMCYVCLSMCVITAEGECL